MRWDQGKFGYLVGSGSFRCKKCMGGNQDPENMGVVDMGFEVLQEKGEEFLLHLGDMQMVERR